ncbi:unnamed protein product [Victoria cruziana]
MEQVEAEISRVLQDHQKLCANIRVEEAKIDSLNKDIKLCEERMRESVAGDLEKQRIQNLLSYQSTLILRASSQTQLIRALHEDLLVLFSRRKHLRQSGVTNLETVPNVSLSSGLSCGNEDNQDFPNNCTIAAAMDAMRVNEEQNDNLEEVTTEQEEQLPLGMKMLQINMNEDASLTPEEGSEYGDLQYKDNILDNLAMTILDPSTNVDNIFKEAIENSDFVVAESQGTGNMTKRVDRVNCRNFTKHLTVDFDENGSPTGPNAGGFKRSINSFVCQFLPINFKQIGDVPIEDYKTVLNMLTERYNFDLSRSYTRKKISSCYRQHKYKLLVQIKKDLERGIEPRKPSYVKEEDWDAFVAKTRDEEFDRISKKNKASRSQQTAHNRKNLQGGGVRKRKMKVLEQSFADEDVWEKVPKPKRGRPKKSFTGLDENHEVDESMGLLETMRDLSQSIA